MNEVLKTVLSLSLSATLVMLVLLMLRPVFQKRFSKQWQYYIWLVVIARLMLPIAPKENLVGTLFQEIDQAIGQEEMVSHFQGRPAGSPPTITETDEPQNLGVNQIKLIKSAGNLVSYGLAASWNNLWLFWIVAALILFIRKITVYQDFVTYIRAGCVEVEDMDLLERFGKLVENSKVKIGMEKSGFHLKRAERPITSLPAYRFVGSLSHSHDNPAIICIYGCHPGCFRNINLFKSCPL